MKLSLKSCINTTSPVFSLFEENKYAYPIGRNLCIKTLAENIYQFIPLNESMEQVLDLAPTSNRKNIVVLELLDNRELHLSLYSVKTSERKSMKITSQSVRKATVLETSDASFATLWLQLAEDQHQVVQVDLSKLKIVATAFTSDALVSVQNNPFNTGLMSLMTRGTLRLYDVKDGGLELTSDLIRKLASSRELSGHVWFDNDIIIAWSTSEVFVVGSTDNELIQTVTVNCAVGEQIEHLKKLGRCIVLVTNVGRCLLYLKAEERFVLYQQCHLPSPIGPIAFEVNHNEDLVVARLPDLSFVSSHVDDISEERVNGQFKTALSFEPSETLIGQLTQRGVSICQTKPLIMFTQPSQNTVSVWNIETYRCFIRKHFTPKFKEDNANILTAGVMHPNGYSLALAFIDRIRFYHLLLDDIKCFYQLPSKRVKVLRYSHGGQFLCYSYGKGKGTFISVINTINMQEICQLKVGSDVHILIWSENDYQLICACQGFVYKWSIIDSFAVRQDIEVNETINLMRYDFKTNKLLVSTKNCILEIENSSNFRRLPVPIPNFHFAYPLDGKYIFGDAEGYLHISQTLECEKAERLAVGTSRSFLYSKSGTLIHLTPETSEVFILRTKAGIEDKSIKEQYILVARSELEKNIEKVRNLETNIQTYHVQLLTELAREKDKMEDIRRKELHQFRREMEAARDNQQNLLTQKTQFEKMSAQLFDTVENCQMKAVDQLEKLYESKLLIERNRVLNLQQKVLEDRMVFESNLKELEAKHHHEIHLIRQGYEDSYRNAFKDMGAVKCKELDLRKELEAKMMEVQQENEHILIDMQLDAESETKQLLQKISVIERSLNTAQADNKNLSEKFRQLSRDHGHQSDQLQRTSSKLEEAKNRIMCLERQLSCRDELLKEKQTKLYQYEFKINDLEKSKHVLNFRTTQIRKELQPKQSQIDKQKRQLFKLEEEFKQAMKENYNCQQKLERAEKNIENTKKELGEVRIKLKKKSLLHEELTRDIYKLVNNLDPKEWNPRIVQIYQQYVGAMAQEDNKKKPNENTAEELNRHLIHLEKSLHQVGLSNDRELKGREKDVTKKLKENAELITDLNDLRKRERQYRTELEAKNNEIIKLQRQLSEVARSSTLRIDSAVTGITGARRTVKPQDSLDTSFRGGMLDHRRSEHTVVTTTQARSRRSNRILSANRTAVCRGSNYDPNSVSMLERNKLYEVMAELQAAQTRIRQQENLIDELNRKAMAQ